MADGKKIKAEDTAEEAYAAAAAEHSFADPAKVVEASEPALTKPVDEVAFPPKAKRGRKPAAAATIAKPEPAAAEPPVVALEKPEPALAETPVAVPEKAEPAPKPAKVAAVAKSRPAGKSVKPAKVVARRVAAKPLPAPAPIKSLMKTRIKVASRPATTKSTKVPVFPTHSNIKDSVMDMSTNFTESFKGIIVEAQEKAKEVFSKGNAAFGDYNDFAKGNVDAVVESGKILAAGLQDLGTNMVAESRSAFETITTDLKELTSVKSPADFFRLQSDFVRRNFDTAVAYGSKNTEAVLKLASEVAAPLSGRVSVAVEKVRQPVA